MFKTAARNYENPDIPKRSTLKALRVNDCVQLLHETGTFIYALVTSVGDRWVSGVAQDHAGTIKPGDAIGFTKEHVFRIN